MANLFIRTYTFVDGTTAYGSQVEAEVGNIVTVLNNLNTAATNWGQVSALHATNVPLIADCAAGSQHIADFKNNSVIKASVSSAGLVTAAGITTSGVLTVTAASGNTVIVNTNDLVVDSTNHRVGIGTASPGASVALDVRGGIIQAFQSFTVHSGSDTATTSLAAGLYVLRDVTNGGAVVILYENLQTPVLISQASGATVFVTGAPAATQIQIKAGASGAGIVLRGGSSRDGTNVQLTTISPQI